ncbi:hypothetical protein [Halobacillus litoralis]|uniref:hypothetical protein n=1 Tax=Halobacillus litoralis TaxID=45668 RepID=UPI001CD6446A|nr:hypothetical protein [Halobacillus litoralis]MCA1023644.1 hypothetical protein [Halobacillus litoralis]
MKNFQTACEEIKQINPSFLPPGAKAPSLSADVRPSFLAKPTPGDLGPLVLPQEWKGHRSSGIL